MYNSSVGLASVAPRTGGRGLKLWWCTLCDRSHCVAPRTGGRGLKFEVFEREAVDTASRPPHRGAWIEITYRMVGEGGKLVAPRTGGRGLKFLFFIFCHLTSASRPPHRGAWIEIARFSNLHLSMQVAPRTGGRGLKSHSGRYGAHRVWSPPAQGGVD